MTESVQTSVLPPVPSQQALQQKGAFKDGKVDLDKLFFSVPWTQWFVALREKLNTINATIAALGDITGNGFISVDGSTGNANTRTITGTAGEINVTNGNGAGGNPTINIIATGITPGTYQQITFDADGRATAVNVTYTVPTLPAGAIGLRAFVTDSNQTMTAGIGTAVATGGANAVPVYYDGIWRIG